MPDSEKIYAAARSLADVINNSGVYQEYRKSLARLKEKPEYFLRVQAFKEACETHDNGEQISLEEEKALSRQYTELTNSPDTAAFLENEKELLQVYSDVLGIIDGACDLELFG